MVDGIKKVNRIYRVVIPKHHRKWAGLPEEEEEQVEEVEEKPEPTEEEKADLEIERLTKLIENSKQKKYVTYNRKGELIINFYD